MPGAHASCYTLATPLDQIREIAVGVARQPELLPRHARLCRRCRQEEAASTVDGSITVTKTHHSLPPPRGVGLALVRGARALAGVVVCLEPLVVGADGVLVSLLVALPPHAAGTGLAQRVWSLGVV